DLQDMIEPETENPDVEDGLIAVVLPPEFPKANRAYVAYTGQDNKLILSRFTFDEAGERAIRSSEEILLSFENWGGLHHCGQMEFGVDGYLYVCVGDSGSAETAQDLSVLNGSILRLDVESDQRPYAIPPTICSSASRARARKSGFTAFATHGVSASTSQPAIFMCPTPG